MAQLQLELKGHTALITIDNPPANTWTAETLTQLRDLVRELNANKDVYALVITGQGQKFFSAGADLNLFASGDKGVASDMARIFGDAFETLSQFRGVSIAATNHGAVAAGCVLLTTTDRGEGAACGVGVTPAHCGEVVACRVLTSATDG